MAKNSPATLNSKTCRISLHTYTILHEMSEHTGISIAEALDKLLWDIELIPKVLSPALTSSSKPARSVTKLIPALGVISSKVAMSANVNKRIVIAIKSKGGITHD